jgi:multisubunit Na+/H+ antiporter MnhB subunit
MYLTKQIGIMIIGLLKDPWTGVSIIGMMMMSITQFISTHLNPLVAFIAGCLGLVMLILGIVEKIISIRKSLKHRGNQK